jgi:cell division protein FtsQ
VDAYPQEVLADEEPKYLRRQKPLEIKRRKFGGRAWKTYLRVAMWTGAGLAGVWLAYNAGHFLLAVVEVFAADRGKSILRVPIAQRRRQLESISWIEHATVRRALPNTIEVEITERTPIAFLRQGSEMSLVDAHGVILERPVSGDFRFPVVTGILSDMPQDEREKRMQLFAGFSQQAEEARAGAMQQVSEVDLSDANDLTARVTGLQPADSASESWGASGQPVVVHFGDTDFEAKFRTLLDDIGEWRAAAGRVESVDLRFSREAIVNPDTAGASQQKAQQRPQRAAPSPAAVHKSAVKRSQ